MKLIFHRVFDGDDLIFVVADLVQGRVKSSCFTRTRWSGYKYHAVRFFNIEPESRHIVRIESDDIKIEVFKALVNLLFVQNTNNSIFAVDRRHYRYSEIDGTAFIS